MNRTVLLYGADLVRSYRPEDGEVNAFCSVCGSSLFGGTWPSGDEVTLRPGGFMADILQDFPIDVPPSRVFEAVTSPTLLDQWWTLRSSGQPALGATYELDFGPKYLWRAVVTRSVPGATFELRLTHADPDWIGTLVGFELSGSGLRTEVRFHHRGWPEVNEHYRISCHCWALYLRVLRRYLEFGETVPYDKRLTV